MFDCRRYQEFGHKTSGVYQVTPLNMNTKLDVYCDMTTDGGGWLVKLTDRLLRSFSTSKTLSRLLFSLNDYYFTSILTKVDMRKSTCPITSV